MVLTPNRSLGLKPPLGASLNYGNTLAQGLVGAWLFNEGGGLNARSHILKSDVLLLQDLHAGAANPPLWLTQPNLSNCVQNTITGINVPIISLAAPSSLLQPTDVVSIFWFGNIFNATLGLGSQNPTLVAMSYAGSNTSPYWAYGIARRSANGNQLFYYDDFGGTNNAATITFSPASGIPFSVGQSLKSGSQLGFLNGSQVYSNTAAGLMSYSGTPTLFLNSNYNNDLASTSVSILLIYHRFLSPSEHLRLALNPYEPWNSPSNTKIFGPLGVVPVTNTFADALSLSDILYIGKGDLFSEALSFSDTVSAISPSANQTFVETINVTDSVQTFLGLILGDEVFSIQDQLDYALGINNDFTDSLSLSDSIISAAGAMGAAQDALSFSDNVTTQLNSQPTTELVDSLTLSDSILTAKTGSLSTVIPQPGDVNNLVMTDSVRATLHIAQSVSDSFTFSDSTDSGGNSSTSLSDSLVLSDNVLTQILQPGHIIMQFSESLVFSDNPGYQGTELGILQIGEMLSLGDSIQTALQESRNSYLRRYLNDAS